MKKIILANVGNRNILFKGEAIHPTNYRQNSRELWDRWEEVKEDIQPNIISEVIRHYGEELEQVILFASDAPEGPSRNDQDTIYAAQMLQKYYEQHLPEVPVKLIKVTHTVVEENDLVGFYFAELRKLKRNHPDLFPIVCDAGGAPAMKNALKNTAEFLYQDGYLLVKVLHASHGISQLKEEPPLGYRKLQLAEICRFLILKGQYFAVRQLIHKDPKTDLLHQFLEIGELRINLRYQEVAKLAKGLSHKVYDLEVKALLQFLANKKLDHAQLNELITDSAGFVLREMLGFARYAYDAGDYSKALLHLQIFFESYLQFGISKVYGLDLFKSYEGASDELMAKIKDLPNVELYLKRTKFSELRKGNPAMILALEYDADANPILNPIHIKILSLAKQLFFSWNNAVHHDTKYLDSLRNKYAHNGLTVRKSDLSKLAVPFEQALHDLEQIFPTKLYSFHHMNELFAVVFERVYSISE